MIKNFWKNKKISKIILNNYDYLVNNINCKYVWKCDQQKIKKLYQKNITKNHLEIGPGTGYFLKDFQFDNLIIMDINRDVLTESLINLKDNAKKITALNHNIFEENNMIDLDGVESVGLSYVLHCVPGRLNQSMENMVNNINNSNPIYFGSTVLPSKHIDMAMIEIQILNKLGIFNNMNHSEADIEEFLKLYNSNIIKEGHSFIFDFK